MRTLFVSGLIRTLYGTLVHTGFVQPSNLVWFLYNMALSLFVKFWMGEGVEMRRKKINSNPVNTCTRLGNTNT